jgi:ubiquinone/menaquinone biosynthesis C-methylase UbiE
MTPEMVQRATATAKRMGVANVELKLGEIEQIPLNDESVNVIMSNCVICLSPDKQKVFQEMSRVLRQGGALAIADELAVRPFSEEEKADPGKWCSCITGAVTECQYKEMLEESGFAEVYVKQLRPSTSGPSPGVFGAFVSAIKPLK